MAFALDTTQVLIAQLGARRHYAVPRAFATVGLLHKFCTDIYLTSRVTRTSLAVLGKVSGSNRIGGLAGRGGAGLPTESVRTFPRFGLAHKWRIRRARNFEQRASEWVRSGRRFCELVIQEVDNECGTFYAFSSAALELFQHGRETQRRCYLDHATAPLHAEMALVREEEEHFEGWSLMPVEGIDLDDYRERQRMECQIADVVLCGSSFARRLLETEGVDSRRIRTVPLAVSGAGDAKPCSRVDEKSLRVLFVGGDGLRKGVGYLSQAVEMLKSRCIEARVAGELGITQRGIKELSRNLKLLGPVPRTEVKELYQWADVLVLPSVSDTFGIVMLEAMASGVPVVATANTGGPDIIREGVDGFIVPIRDSLAIAEKLDVLASNPGLLSTMSRCAAARADEFSLARYSERLVNATMTE